MHIAPVRTGQKFNLTAEGYAPAETYYSGQDVLRVPMQPKLNGRVTDAATGGSVVFEGQELVGLAPSSAFEGFPQQVSVRNRVTIEDALAATE